MRTIFITSFHTLISRNILQTKLLSLLTNANNRIVILVPDYKKDYFSRIFGGANVLIQGIDTKLTKKDLLFRKLTLALTPTRSMYLKKRSDFYRHKNLPKFLVAALTAYLFGRFSPGIKLARLIDYLLLKQETFRPLFQAFKPDLIFSTDLQNELDVRLLQEARKAGIKTIGMVRSWDNITTKGLLRIIPDKVIVHNEIIKQEVVRYSRVNLGRISVIGIPHYDRYSGGPTKTRADFFRDHGFDLDKKLILIAPVGNRYIYENKTDMLVLRTLGKLDLNILVRIPPNDIASYSELHGARAKIFFDKVGFNDWRRGRKLNEVSQNDDDSLINALSWSDLVVTHLATMCIDAAFFNKPIVVVGNNFTPHPRWDVIRYYFEYEHIQPVLRSGGIKIAGNPEELLSYTAEYLEQPSLDAQGRRTIVAEQVHFTDGRSTERLADIILKA